MTKRPGRRRTEAEPRPTTSVAAGGTNSDHLRGPPGIRAFGRRAQGTAAAGGLWRDPAYAAGPATAKSAPPGGRPGGGQLAVASSNSAVSPLVMPGSTGMPGPIVVENVTFFTYRPLAAAGLSLTTSSTAAA